MEIRITAAQARENINRHECPSGAYHEICIVITQYSSEGRRWMEFPKSKMDLDTCKRLSDDGFFIYAEDKDTLIISWMEFELFFNSFIKGS